MTEATTSSQTPAPSDQLWVIPSAQASKPTKICFCSWSRLSSGREAVRRCLMLSKWRCSLSRRRKRNWRWEILKSSWVPWLPHTITSWLGTISANSHTMMWSRRSSSSTGRASASHRRPHSHTRSNNRRILSWLFSGSPRPRKSRKWSATISMRKHYKWLWTRSKTNSKALKPPKTGTLLDKWCTWECNWSH